ncbi:hypothetical protein [Paracoccus aestuariivivens]|uniref:Gluconate 2-dehydrogenase subunit 3 family protein n=1 Tax=Paracoccus aestuariivivens TaxID=1820333 RepID=A0A6L6JD62_9RHOB|nr:hypothetical protein [Paracoccus aestuariivivens]MTH80123.1 hypothetical protein [Paracoccus aestuariivivens]
MPQKPTSHLLVAALLAVTAAPVFAQQSVPPRLDISAQFENPPSGSEHVPWQMPRDAMPEMRLAERLAAAEIYLGITTEQEPAWRDYCQALLKFAPVPFVADDKAPSADPNGQMPKRLMSEVLAQNALNQSEKARTLLNAVSALRSSLDPDQIERLAWIEPSFHQKPHGPFPHGGPDWPQVEHWSGPIRQIPHHVGPEMPAPDMR